MIAAQKARRVVVGVAVGALLEHTVSDEQSQDPPQRVRVEAGTRGNLSRVRRLVADRVCNSKRGRHVQAARSDVRPRELADDARRRRRAHYWMIWRF